MIVKTEFEGFLMSAEKERRFRGEASCYIFIKDYEDKTLYMQ